MSGKLKRRPQCIISFPATKNHHKNIFMTYSALLYCRQGQAAQQYTQNALLMLSIEPLVTRTRHGIMISGHFLSSELVRRGLHEWQTAASISSSEVGYRICGFYQRHNSTKMWIHVQFCYIRQLITLDKVMKLRLILKYKKFTEGYTR
jgi:hypothetical protein